MFTQWQAGFEPNPGALVGTGLIFEQGRLPATLSLVGFVIALYKQGGAWQATDRPDSYWATGSNQLRRPICHHRHSVLRLRLRGTFRFRAVDGHCCLHLGFPRHFQCAVAQGL
ncbi:hypothetical protein D3C87_1815830 [compost metagenome]